MSSIEVDATNAAWRKASRSVANGACVEAAPATAAIMVRDSLNRSGLVVTFPVHTWQAFLSTAKAGTFDIASLS